MPSLNKVMIIGNAGRDAEMRYTANGRALTTFSVAVNRNYRGQDGEWQKETEWFNVSVWGDQAERVGQWLTKGRLVYVEGRLQTRSWDDEQGVKQYRTDLVANTVKPLDRGDGGEGGWDDDDGGFARGGGGGRSRGGGDFDRESFGGRGGGGSRSRGNLEDSFDADDLPFE
jgi:single-strand DNA-binding protein